MTSLSPRSSSGHATVEVEVEVQPPAVRSMYTSPDLAIVTRVPIKIITEVKMNRNSDISGSRHWGEIRSVTDSSVAV